MAEWKGFIWNTFSFIVAVKSGRRVQSPQRRTELPTGARQRESEGSGGKAGASARLYERGGGSTAVPPAVLYITPSITPPPNSSKCLQSKRAVSGGSAVGGLGSEVKAVITWSRLIVDTSLI